MHRGESEDLRRILHFGENFEDLNLLQPRPGREEETQGKERHRIGELEQGRAMIGEVRDGRKGREYSTETA
jgi:hypothetical protein